VLPFNTLHKAVLVATALWAGSEARATAHGPAGGSYKFFSDLVSFSCVARRLALFLSTFVVDV
jgi:hypothetical protein